MQPVTVQQEFESVLNSAKTNVKVTTQRQAFTREEAVQLEIEIDNEKGDATVEGIEGRISLEGKLYSLSFMEEEINLKGKKVKISFPVEEGEHGKCKLKIPFNFQECGMDNNLMPVAPGALLENEYMVNPPTYNIKLKFIRKGLQNESFDMKIPISIGTVNTVILNSNNVRDLPIPHENILYE